MPVPFLYFDLQHAVNVHDWIIEQSGGRPGENDLGLLDSLLSHIQNDVYYPSFEDKLLHLVFAVNKSHAFTDGNKRSSIALGAYFLEVNGYGYCVKNFVHRMENIAVWVAEGSISKELLGSILVSLMYEEDYSDELKLRIIEALTPIV